MHKVPKNTTAVAVVGMACEYPDAQNPAELFDNVMAGRRAFRRIPDVRLPLSVYGSQRADAIDQTYLTKAALIEGYHFDREAFKIVGSTYRQADLTHWLALDVANRALEDAGFKDAQGSPREKTGVVLGNTLTGEFSRAQLMRLRWPYVQRLLRAELAEIVTEEEALAALLEKIESRYKAPFEVFGDESLAGGLSNTIAGRICNYFDFKGGGYTVDGACSSSLLAISQACDALVRGDLDLALAGGVDLSLDPFELVGFSRAGALARQDMRVYEKASAGFWPGEGCGFLVLMREEDVTTQPVYARIRGWGMSSDGAGGISRPDVDGQAFALRRAYARAGVDPGSIGYFEGHGTGTVIGDETELRALTKILGQRSEPVPIGSIKANIGHTKAAAGIAGSLKAILAVAQGVIPPMPHPLEPHDLVNPAKGASLYVEGAGTAWTGTEPRRAAVSSMGFGGINTHLVLEEGKQSTSKVTFKPVEPLPISHQESELFIFAAKSFEEMLAQVTKVANKAASLSFAELTDLAGELADRAKAAPCRAALVASTPEYLLTRLEMLRTWLTEAQDKPKQQPYRRISADQSLALGQGTEQPKIGFLFPGQGTVLPASLEVLLARCASLETRGPGEHYLQTLSAYGQEALREPVDTAIAQPMLCALNVFALRFIDELGVKADVALGHSLGELSALHWAGALSQESLLDLAHNRGAIMSRHAHAGGAMAGFRASWKQMQPLLEGTALVLAGQNGPEKSVVSGTLEEIEDLLGRAKAEGIAGMRLPVSHAFHSPLIEPCVPIFADYLKGVSFAPLAQDSGFISTRTGTPLPTSVDLAQHLVEQLRAPVLFADALKSVEGQVDLWLELGSGQNLATLASGCVDAPCLSLNAGDGKVRDLFALVGAAYAFGAPVKWRQLFQGRKHKPLDLDLDFQFFTNPCERNSSPAMNSQREDAVASLKPSELAHASAQEVIKMLVAKRCELPESMVQPENRFLSDLHLTSIAVSSIAAEACRLLKKPPLVAPSEFANATIDELAKALDSSVRRIPVQGPVLGVDAWLRPFSVDWSEQELARPSNAPVTNGDSDTWFVLADKDNRFVQKVEVHLNQNLRAGGVLLYLGPEQDDADAVDLLLQAAKHVLEAKHTPFFVLLHHDSPAASIARTLHLEAHSLRTRIIDLSHCQPEPEVVLREIESSAVYTECAYQADGRRFEKSLTLLPRDKSSAGHLPFVAGDVVLVSGGAKGIAAECALRLAQECGCTLGLIGREPFGDACSAELRGNLQRFEAKGIRFCYRAADVGDPVAIKQAVEDIEREVGPVCGLIHGAGINEPQSLLRLATQDFLKTMAPKVKGLEHLLEAVDPENLKSLVAFGSVIAHLGLPGEADYAWANELLARKVSDFAQRHPYVDCLTLDWSLWSGVGMGEKLGRMETLVQQGITPISPELGVQGLLELMRWQDRPADRVFVSGRFGKPETLRCEASELPLHRFVEKIQVDVPGVELIADTEISLGRDPYLADHVVAGSVIVPGVAGLEAMSQVTGALAGKEKPTHFTKVEFLQPIEVPITGEVTLRVAALARNAHEFDVVVRSSTSKFALDHMRARLCYGQAEISVPTAQPLCETEVTLDASKDLYGNLLFHKGRFARILKYRALHRQSCQAEILVRKENYFAPYEVANLSLGDLAARDAFIHAIQACVPHRQLLPVAVDTIVPGDFEADAHVILQAQERAWDGEQYIYDVDIFNCEGTHIEAWRGLVLRPLAQKDKSESWSPALIAPYLEDVLREVGQRHDVCAALVPGDDRKASTAAVALASDGVEVLRWRNDGAPLCDSGRYVSISHGETQTLAVLSTKPIACDLEVVEDRPENIWRDILGENGTHLLEFLGAEFQESLHVSATRIWGAFECFKKMGLDRNTPLVLAKKCADGTLLFDAGAHQIVSCEINMKPASCAHVFTVLLGGNNDLL